MMATVRVNGYPTHIIFTQDVPSGNEWREARSLFNALLGNLNGMVYDHLFKLMKAYYDGEVDSNGDETPVEDAED